MLAVAIQGNEVAPRFCSADQFAIAKLDGGRAHRICRLTIQDQTGPRRLECLSVAGVHVLLCGSFNRSFLPHAKALGIRVISGLAGEAERLIDTFARGDIEQYRVLPSRRESTARYAGGWLDQSHHQELFPPAGVSCDLSNSYFGAPASKAPNHGHGRRGSW